MAKKTEPIVGAKITSANPTGAKGTLISNKNPIADSAKMELNKQIAIDQGQQAQKSQAVNPQTGSTGNAAINPYSNAYEAYQTALGKVKEAQLGQLATEYNNQQKQIEGAYQGLNRNAYVTYMQRNLQNRQALSNMGANRTGFAENMNTANAVDYNRSVGNIGAYRQNKLSDAENAYNSRVADLEANYATQLANAQNQYAQLEIARQNQLADQQSQMDFQASENAKDRQQNNTQFNRNLQQQQKAYQDEKNKWNFDNYVTNTVNRYTTVKQVDNAIKKWQDRKKSGDLNNWQTAYYSQAIQMLKMQKAELSANSKKSSKKK